MSFSKLFGGETVINSARITILWGTLPKIVLVFCIFKVLKELFFSGYRYIANSAMEIVRFPKSALFKICFRNNSCNSAMILI